MARVFSAILRRPVWRLVPVWLLGAVLSVTIGAGADADAADLLQVHGANVKWSPPLDGRTTVVSYAVLGGPRAMSSRNAMLSANNCGIMQGLTEAIAASPRLSREIALRELHQAFSAWEKVANIKFVEIADVDRANIVIGATHVPKGKAFANLSLRRDGARGTIASALGEAGRTAVIAPDAGIANKVEEIEKAYVCLNANAQWKRGFDGNLDVYDLRHTFTHEIGHAIGLDHPDNAPAVMGFRYDERIPELQPVEIAAAQRLYGAPDSQRRANE